MIAHALNGHSEVESNIKIYIETLLDTYLCRMEEDEKNPAEIAGILNIFGWCGWFQYGVFYVQTFTEFVSANLQIMTDYYPVQSDKNTEYVRDAVGIFGLKLIRLFFDTEYYATLTSTKDSRCVFTSLLEEEVAKA